VTCIFCSIAIELICDAPSIHDRGRLAVAVVVDSPGVDVDRDAQRVKGIASR
jgi:hypothetical protein